MRLSATRTVDEEHQDAFLYGVICVGDVALHLVSKLLILAADLDQLPGNGPQRSREAREHLSASASLSLIITC